MNTKQKRDLYRKIISNITLSHLTPAFSDLKEFSLITSSGSEIADIDMEEEIYSQMLRYFILDAPDPKREQLKDTIRKKLLSVADNLYASSLSSAPHDHWYLFRKRYAKNNPVKKQELYELHSWLEEISPENNDKIEERLERLLFGIWMTEKISDDQISIISDYLKSEFPDTGLGSILVTSIILHTLEKFSPGPWLLLADIYETKHQQIWQRALMGMMLIIIRFEHRLKLFPEIEQRLMILAENEDFISHLEIVAVQLVRTGDTEKVSRRIQEEIIPEMMKLAPKIQEKLSLDQFIQDEAGEEKNPEWEKFFEDSPEVYQKMEELNKLQSEGVDLFISTFSKLKHFPFFQVTSNWFLPYSHVHPTLVQDIDQDDSISLESFFEIFSKFPMMCNSDKYSFSFNILEMPEEQRKMIMNALSGEMGEMIKITESDGLVTSTEGIEVFHQFAQDLYRFFRVHPAHQETEDPFAMRRQLYQCHTMDNLFNHFPVLVRRIGEYYFHNEHYDHAIKLFSRLENEPQSTPELFQKLAYAWQMSGDLDKALEYYKKAELFDSNALWNLKKIAWCYHLQNKLDDAVKAYRDAERMAPESVQIKLSIGNLLLQQGKWNEALECYLEAEAINPGNEKTLRPVAWCLFLQGELEASELYYEQIMEKKFNHNDLLNFGHVKFALKKKELALATYKESLNHRNNKLENFRESFQNDNTHLERLGIPKHEIAFMLDAVIENK